MTEEGVNATSGGGGPINTPAMTRRDRLQAWTVFAVVVVLTAWGSVAVYQDPDRNLGLIFLVGPVWVLAAVLVVAVMFRRLPSTWRSAATFGLRPWRHLALLGAYTFFASGNVEGEIYLRLAALALSLWMYKGGWEEGWPLGRERGVGTTLPVATTANERYLSGLILMYVTFVALHFVGALVSVAYDL